jgi:hypothetical protein
MALVIMRKMGRLVQQLRPRNDEEKRHMTAEGTMSSAYHEKNSVDSALRGSSLSNILSICR